MLLSQSMSDALRESMKPLPKREGKPQWVERQPKGVISQGEFERSRGKKASWKAK